MKPKSRKRASALQPACARNFLPQTSLPSMPVWLVHSHNCASSGATDTNPGERLAEKRGARRDGSRTLLSSNSSRGANSAIKLLPLMETPETFGIIAGSGVYPLLLADAARVAGVKKVIVAAFTDETSPEIANRADQIEWLRVGQLGKLLNFFRDANVRHAIMAGQIAPSNLFNLRPDFKAMFLLARLKRRNAESIFSAIGDQLSEIGVELLPATTFLDQLLAPSGLIAGPKLKDREEEDVSFGFEIAKQLSALDVGQTIVVKNGTVLAVEAFEGTNEAIRRGGSLGKKNAIVIKVTVR